MICTFFGHRNTSDIIIPKLKNAIIDLITSKNVDTFYVGNNGQFDSIVQKALNDLSKQYNINYYIVLAYIPMQKATEFLNYELSIIPNGIEKVPKRFAILYRNKWMINKSDYIISYIENRVGSGAYKAITAAEKLGKTIINLAE